jgi:hypothetical protein
MNGPAHNLEALLLGYGEFSFCPDALTTVQAVAEGYIPFGNIKAFTPKPEVSKLVHHGSYRGRKLLDLIVATQSETSYALSCEEWKRSLLELLFGASVGDGHTQVELSADDADAILFSDDNPSSANRWYDLTASGKRIIDIQSVTIAGLEEDDDFEVDRLLGKIRFLLDQTADVIPVVTAPEITSSDSNFMPSLLPGEKTSRLGIGRLTCFDRLGVVFDHREFLCELSAEVSSQVDGDKFAEMTITVSVMAALPGEIYCRGYASEQTVGPDEGITTEDGFILTTEDGTPITPE